jgi:hypothetical protein
MASKVVFVLMAAHPSAVVLLVSWIYSRLGTDEWLFLPSFLFLVSNISLAEMLSEVVAQHDEALCVLLRQPILWSDDLMAKSSDALFDKEAWIVVIFLPLWEDLPYQWRDAVSWENCWLQPLVVPLNSLFLVHKKFVVLSSHSKLEPGQDLVWRG